MMPRYSKNGESMYPSPGLAAWRLGIVDRWSDFVRTWDEGEGYLLQSVNYFEPRPYVDQYNRGSISEGFIYVLGGDAGFPDKSVCIHYITDEHGNEGTTWQKI